MISQAEAARLMAAHEKVKRAEAAHAKALERWEVRETAAALEAAEAAFQELLATLIDENDR